MARQVPWLRIAAEGFAIVVSILLAFGIQAWWDARQDRIEETRALMALDSELQENVEIIRGSIDSHELSRQSAERLSDISIGLTEPPSTPLDLVSLVGQTFLQYRTTNLSLGTVTALLASGDIGLIQDFEIRRRVASLQGLIEDALEDEAVALEIRNRSLMPFQVEHFPTMGRNPPQRSQPVASQQSTDIAATQILQILGDDQFEGWIGQSIQHHGTARASLERLEVFVLDLIERLDQELARRRGS